MVQRWRDREVFSTFAYLTYFLPLLSTLSPLGLYVVDIPVAVKIPLKNMSVSEDDSVTLSCKLTKPDKPVKWYKDGKILKDGVECNISSDGCEYTLKLPKAKTSDAGHYTMKCDKIETSAKVIIKGEI